MYTQFSQDYKVRTGRVKMNSVICLQNLLLIETTHLNLRKPSELSFLLENEPSSGTGALKVLSKCL